MKQSLKFFAFIGILIFMTFSGKPPGESGKRQPSKTPNVVIIFMDDMGYGDPVCYGGGPYHTPNIDALAASGMRFTQFYAAQAVCSASRSALLTGCYPTRLSMHGAINHSSKYCLNPDEQTIAELLKPVLALGMLWLELKVLDWVLVPGPGGELDLAGPGWVPPERCPPKPDTRVGAVR